jgi:hypothetical protein
MPQTRKEKKPPFTAPTMTAAMLTGLDESQLRQMHDQLPADDRADVVAEMKRRGLVVVPVLRCALCSDAVTEESFCHGCKKHVCEECGVSSPWGPHDVMDHQDEPEEPESEDR